MKWRYIAFVMPCILIALSFLPPLSIYLDPAADFGFPLHLFSYAIVVLLCSTTAFMCTRETQSTPLWLRWNAVFWTSVFVGLVIAIQYNAVNVTRFFGSLTLSAVFLTFLFAVGSYLWILHRRIFALTVVTMTAAVLFLPAKSDLRQLGPVDEKHVWSGPEENYRECEYRSDTNCAFISWLTSRPDLSAYKNEGRPYPVFFVSAEGGGIYAAAHAFTALNTFSVSCPNFRQHVFSISSVSGGSVGSAAYVADNSHQKIISNIEQCILQTSEKSQKFENDFLSPVLGTFLFGNVPNFFSRYTLGLNDSTKVLEDVFVDELDFSNLEGSIKEYWQPNKSDPVLLMNTTNLSSGRIETVSPFPSGRGLTTGSSRNEAYGPNNGMVDANVSLIAGASLSARFPFLTPSGQYSEQLEINEEQVVRYSTYVDGGYFDNSGIGVSRQIVDDLEESWNSGLNYYCKEFPDKFCSYILLDRGALESDASVATIGDPYSGDENGEIDPIYKTPEYEKAAECITKTPAVCAEEIWEAGIIPISVHHLVLYAEPNHWQEADLEALKHLYRGKRKQSFFDPVKALLSTRSSRAAIERNDLLYKVYGSWLSPHARAAEDNTVVLQNLDVEASGFPLSWSLGSRLTDELVENVSDVSGCEFGPFVHMPDQTEILNETYCAIGDIAVILTRKELITN